MRSVQKFWRRVGSLVPACAMAALTISLAAVVSAQSRPDDAASRLARRHAEVLAARATVRTAAMRGVTVVGLAWTEDQQPVVSPRVRLRSADSGTVEAETVGSPGGEFIFDRVRGGSYVVELVDEDEAVQAVGAMLTAAPGDVVATLIMVAKQRTFVEGVFSQMSANVVSTATSVGMTGLTDTGRPVTREQ